MKYEGLSNSRGAGTKHKSKDRSVKVRGRTLGDLHCYTPVHMAAYQRFSLDVTHISYSEYREIEKIPFSSSLMIYRVWCLYI